MGVDLHILRPVHFYTVTPQINNMYMVTVAPILDKTTTKRDHLPYKTIWKISLRPKKYVCF